MDTNFFVSAMSLLTVAAAVPAAKVISRRHRRSRIGASGFLPMMNYGRGRGLGRTRGVGLTLGAGVEVALGVTVGVGVAVGVVVGLGVGVGLGAMGAIAYACVSPL